MQAWKAREEAGRVSGASPYRPQANGRPERFLRNLELGMRYRSGLEGYIDYNEDRLHGSLDIDSLETYLRVLGPGRRQGRSGKITRNGPTRT